MKFAIMSACHHVNMPTCHHVILSTCQLVSFSAFQLAHLGACKLVRNTLMYISHGKSVYFISIGVYISPHRGV